MPSCLIVLLFVLRNYFVIKSLTVSPLRLTGNQYGVVAAFITPKIRDLCHLPQITESDLLQISQPSNWGKIYGVNYPFFTI